MPSLTDYNPYRTEPRRFPMTQWLARRLARTTSFVWEEPVEVTRERRVISNAKAAAATIRDTGQTPYFDDRDLDRHEGRAA